MKKPLSFILETCPKCGAAVPAFPDLPAEQEQALIQLVHEEKGNYGMHQLRELTGCDISLAKSWKIHHEPEALAPPTPCPYCGQTLRTKTAQQCRHCGQDWHDQPK